MTTRFCLLVFAGCAITCLLLVPSLLHQEKLQTETSLETDEVPLPALPFFSRQDKDHNTINCALDGDSVICRRANFVCKIPSTWRLSEHQIKEYCYFDSGSLSLAAIPEGECTKIFASVRNSLYPYDLCMAHLGSGGWLNGWSGLGEVYVGIYDLSSPVMETLARFEDGTRKEFERLRCNVRRSQKKVRLQNWNCVEVNGMAQFGDYSDWCNLEICALPTKRGSLVFLFYWTGRDACLSITEVLSSVQFIQEPR